jgi:hypothetical protein
VLAKDGARIQTAPRANSDTVLRTVANVDADLDTPPPYDRLALLVQADNVDATDVSKATREIRWDADVEITAGPSPEVLIDASGVVVKAIGATVTLGAGANGDATVSDISGSGAGGGQVLFIANKIFNDVGDVGNDFRAMFQFADTFAGVTITNLSTRRLIINDISVGGGTEPFVDLQANGDGADVGLTFDLRRTVASTLVLIQNLNTATSAAPDIVLNGRIENPIGETRIVALTGDIVAGTTRDPLGGPDSTLIRTRDLTLDAQKGTIGYDTQIPGARNHLAVDIVQGPLVAFDSAHHLETGDEVVYHASVPSSSLGNLVDGGHYFVIRLDDLRLRLAASLLNAQSGTAIAIDPANLNAASHTITMGNTTLAITDGIRLVAQAGADDYIDLKGRLRDPAALLGDAGDANPDPHVFNIDLIRAGLLAGGGNVDVILQSAVLEASTAHAGGVRVRATQGPAVNAIWFNQFRPDDPAGASQGSAVDVAFFGAGAVSINGTYNFVTPLGAAGLVADGAGPGKGNVVVTAAVSTPVVPWVNVTGVTEVLASGHIDVLTNGFVTLTEQTGDMRVGTITSTGNDVSLTAPSSIVDALADAEADVTGRNITLLAKTGGIGSAGNFLETNLLDNGLGVLRADAPQSIYIEETSGDLRVHHVYSTGGNVTLVGRAGSILDGNDDVNPTQASGGTYTDAQGRVRDAVNVAALNIALDARGAASSIGSAGDDLDIDSRTGGLLFAQAGLNLFATEVNGELDVIAARALGGTLRLTVPDTGAADTENLVLLAGGSARVLESGDSVVTLGEITAYATVALWVGDNVSTNANSRIVAGTGITIRGDTRRVGKTDNVDNSNADAGRGTQMDLRGTIGSINAPSAVSAANTTAKTFTEIFGHVDIDTFTFDRTKLDANTTVFGSQHNVADLLVDGEDRFIVNQLQSMHVDRNGVGDTLTLDGQAGTDYYSVNTAGSQARLATDTTTSSTCSTPAARPTASTSWSSAASTRPPAVPGSGDDIFLLAA